jgi:hypothetical protein
MTACRTCEIGAAHARGELPTHWPDGTPIVRLEIVSRSPGAPPAKARKAASYPRTEQGSARGRAAAAGRPAGLYRSGDVELTIRQWAERLGTTEWAVRQRISKYGVERLSEPRRKYPPRKGRAS